MPGTRTMNSAQRECWKSAPAPAAIKPGCSPATCSDVVSLRALQAGASRSFGLRSHGGFRNNAEVKGRGAFAELKFESRSTACSGCRHRNAGPHPLRDGTVAVLPEVEEVDIQIKQEDLASRPCAPRAPAASTSTDPRGIRQFGASRQGILVMMQDDHSRRKNRPSRGDQPACVRASAPAAARRGGAFGNKEKVGSAATIPSASAPIIPGKSRVTDHRST